MINPYNFVSIAIDVWPRYLDAALTHDFSDLSLLHLIHEPPAGIDFRHPTATVRRIKGQCFQITPEPVWWSTGEPVVIEHYLFNFQRLQIIDSLRGRGRRTGTLPFGLSNPLICDGALHITSEYADESMLTCLMSDPIMAPFPVMPSSDSAEQLFHQCGSPVTGPFTVLRHDEEAIQLRANPYFQGHVPMLHDIHVLPFPDHGDAHRAFVSGKIDLGCLTQFGCVPDDRVEVDRMQIGSGTLPLVGMVIFNTERPHWRKVRSALARQLPLLRLPNCCVLSRLPIPRQILDYASYRFGDQRIEIELIEQACAEAAQKTPMSQQPHLKCHLKVNYASYYPNRNIVDQLGECAAICGFQVEAIEIPYRTLMQQCSLKQADMTFAILSSRIPDAAFFFHQYLGMLRKSTEIQALAKEFADHAAVLGSQQAAAILCPQLIENLPILPICTFRSRFWIRPKWKQVLTTLINSRTLSFLELDDPSAQDNAISK